MFWQTWRARKCHSLRGTFRVAVDCLVSPSMRYCNRMLASRCVFLLITVLAGGAILPAVSEARKRAPAPPPLSADAVNNAQYSPAGLGRPNPVMLKAQILLDQAAISPG